jgi:hypothetical protein
MPLSFIFWLVYLLCFIFSYWSGGYYQAGQYRLFGPWVAVFILIGLLGWRTFGFIIQG